jgi:sugar phosphate isomerase/epimerase
MTQTMPPATINQAGVRPRLAAFPKGFFERMVARQMTIPGWIELAGELEIDGVELHPAFFDDFDTATMIWIGRKAAAHQLAVPMLCHSPDFTQPDPIDRAAEVARSADMLRVTAELGGAYCRVLSGQQRPGLVEAEALAWVIDCLWQLEPVARDAGVVMCLENHYKDTLWTQPEFAQSHARYLAILDAVDSPWLAVQYDPSNAIVAGEDQYALLERVLPRVATVHASDRYLEQSSGTPGPLVHGIVGQGLNDYDRIFSMLAQAGFAGWISIEDGEGPTIDEGMDNLRASVAFVRGNLASRWTPGS